MPVSRKNFILAKKYAMNNSFANEEARCEYIFSTLGPFWHLYTPENHPVILVTKEDYCAAMTLLAICALNFPNVRILTFQWMSNHLHVTLSGPEKDIVALFAMLKKYLGYYLKSIGREVSLEGWDYRMRRVDSLNDIRNVIAYNNRNGFLVYSNYSPYSYPWGANKCFFNDDLAKRYEESGAVLRAEMIRRLFHTRALDSHSGLTLLDGYVCPLAFCDIKTAEGLFRNARHYFYSLSRNIERMKAVADEIGESIYYTDSDLFAALCSHCKEKYGIDKPQSLPPSGKAEMARMMHFEYNAGVKQIARMLKIDPALLESLGLSRG